MATVNDKSIPLPVFDGKEQNFTKWMAKMKGFGIAKGIWIAITQKGDLPTTEDAVVDESTATGKQAAKVRNANSLMMAYLLNAFKKDADLQIVMNSFTTDWPSGLAHKAID